MMNSFHTATCSYPDGGCECKAEQFIVTVTLRGTVFLVCVSACPDEAATVARGYRSSGWATRLRSVVVDMAGAEKLDVRKASDELALAVA